MSRLFVMARATCSLENKLTAAQDRKGGHRAGNGLHSAQRLALPLDNQIQQLKRRRTTLLLLAV